MTNNTKSLYDEKVKSLADKYVSEGFQVLIEPTMDQLPFDLGNYQPDIIATKDNRLVEYGKIKFTSLSNSSWHR
jgi:hypothetical protein